MTDEANNSEEKAIEEKSAAVQPAPVQPGKVAREMGLRRAEKLGGRPPGDRGERRAVRGAVASRRFAPEPPGWQIDEKSGPYLMLDGRQVRTRLWVFLDGHGRVCTGIEAFTGGTEANLHGCLRRALESWQRWSLIYSDRPCLSCDPPTTEVNR